jgi:hypothetical protein
MINFNIDYITEDFRHFRHRSNSDYTYLLRMTLFRAANEADRRYYLTTGEKAKEYRRLSYELDEMASDIEHYLDDGERIKPKYIATILEAVILSRHLILLDQRETRAQYDAIIDNLVHVQEDSETGEIAA